MTDEKTRRRWINLGEVIALAALVVSGFGVWIAWKSSSQDKPTRVVEQRQPIPLTLRGTVRNEGRELVIAPVEPSHALESLALTIRGGSPIEIGSDGQLDASVIESAIGSRDDRKGAHNVPVLINASYVEMGKDRRGGGSYILHYRWEGGGLFGGRAVKLTALSR